jgi:hypothetical protein
MATKKRKKVVRGRPPSDRGPRAHALGIKAYPEWKVWVDEFRQHCQVQGLIVPDAVSIIDLALVDFAKKMNFRLPPPR